MKKLELIDINKSYETNVPVLKNVSFSVENGEFLVLLGPSGCGKSTILSIIAGFEKQNDGNIIIDGRNCDTVSCQNRDIAMVFQNYALYPNMNVYNNIAFPLVNRREKKEVVKEKVITISKMLQIEDILGKKVDKISGGQKQRVAIGRALVKNPSLLLLDEPLSNLDALLRSQMRKELYNLHSKLQKTMIYVTHDQTEALSLATKIIVLDKGEIQQIGTPTEIYNCPANEFVASFIGSPQMNLISMCKLCSKKNSLYSLSILGCEYQLESLAPIEFVDVGFRPEDISLVKDENGTIHIKHKEFLGDTYIYHCEVKLNEKNIGFAVKTTDTYNTNTPYNATLKKIHIFDAFSKKRI